MADDKGFAITATKIPLLHIDGRRRFARGTPTGARILQWMLAALWISAAGVTIAAVL